MPSDEFEIEKCDPEFNRVYIASDINDAIDLARSLIRTEGYSYFRGQENSEWGISTTFHRYAEKFSKEEALSKVTTFIAWLNAQCRIRGINYVDDDVLAIAQHFGLPTPFLDFTHSPEKAAYFASSERSVGHGAIFLISDEQVEHISRYLEWSSIIQEQDPPMIFRKHLLNVADLWRLEAQEGLFFETNVGNISEHVRFDRIIFRHKEGEVPFRRDEIYPANKSSLEQEIDKYAQTIERNRFNDKFQKLSYVTTIRQKAGTKIHGQSQGLRPAPQVEEYTESATAVDADIERNIHQSLRHGLSLKNAVPIKALPNTFFPPMIRFKKTELRPHQSWFSQRAMEWLDFRITEFPDPNSIRTLSLEISRGGVEVQRRRLLWTIAPYLFLHAQRGAPLNFKFRINGLTEEGREEKISERIAQDLQRLWDGLRLLPCTTKDILFSIVNYSSIMLAREYDVETTNPFNLYSKLWPDCIRVEFKSYDDCVCQSDIPRSKMLSCLRSDIYDWIEIVDQRVIEEKYHLMTQICYPQYLFDFPKFARLYIRYGIPNRLLEQPKAMIYSPRSIIVWGAR